MKNFKLLLVAAVVFGAGSAFTTVKDSLSATVYYDGSNWHEIPPRATVECNNSTSFCTGTGTVQNPQPSGPKGAANVILP